MAFLASVEQFEGPLDLMLHLIRENKLDIFDLDMTILADQYLLYIKQMEDLELEVESEYLVELATLIEYKSRRLLPKNEDSLEGNYEEDPKEALVRRLLEYQKFKEVALDLDEAYKMRMYQMAKPMSDKGEFESDSDVLYEGNTLDLYRAMNRILRRLQLSKPVATRLAQKEISVDDCILKIKAKLVDLDEVFNFEVLVDDAKSKEEAVVIFLAVLDLIKDDFLSFTVDDSDNIYLKRK